MGGGAVPPPVTVPGNFHSQPLYSQTILPFTSNLNTGSTDLTDDSKRRAIRLPNQTNFGPVPSQTEVQNAISDLRMAMNGFCATNSEVNEFGEMMEPCNYDSSRMLMKSVGQKRFLDAYHLLQTDPLVQRLVLSISSDREVWDAILKNDTVQDLQGSLPPTAAGEEGVDKQESNSTSAIVKWIFAVLKSKIIEFMEKLEVFVLEKLQSVLKNSRSTSKHDDRLEERVRSSLLLSIVILVIVFVTRSI